LFPFLNADRSCRMYQIEVQVLLFSLLDLKMRLLVSIKTEKPGKIQAFNGLAFLFLFIA